MLRPSDASTVEMLDPQRRQLVVFKSCVPNAGGCSRYPRAEPSRSATHTCRGYPRRIPAVDLDSWHGAQALHMIGWAKFRTLEGLVVATCRGTQSARAPRGGRAACEKFYRGSNFGSDQMDELHVVGCGSTFCARVGRSGGPRACCPQHLSCVAPQGGRSLRRVPTSWLLLEWLLPRRQRPMAAITAVDRPGIPRPLVEVPGLQALFPLPSFTRLRTSASEGSTEGLRRLEAGRLDAKRTIERTTLDCAPPPPPCVEILPSLS